MFRVGVRACQPDIYIDVEVVDVRMLEFFKARQVFAQATRANEDFEQELERRRAEQHA